MNSERLPAKAWARQLDRMRQQLDGWYASYRQTSASTTNAWFAARCDDRAAAIADICRHLAAAETQLYDLPRVR